MSTHHEAPVLILMGGLPGVGKSAVADALAPHLGACVVSVDPIEDAMLRSGLRQSFETGLAAYEVGATVAAHQLALGLTVIADAANYIEAGREIWRRAARGTGAPLRVIHVVCSDAEAHRHRLEQRQRGLQLYAEPSWAEIELRRTQTEPWNDDHVVIDSVDPLDVNVEACLHYLAR
jgi:predicted kinase